jgi:beta-phosphoglucomutase-like phosphatase (HAD superfamily)
LKALIFDIDGTLVESTKFDSALYKQAVKHVLGPVTIHADWSAYTHVTDSGILKEIMTQNGISDKTLFTQVKSKFAELIESTLKSTGVSEVPGAKDTLNYLERREDVSIGIATGGWGSTARMKLAAAGFSILKIPFCSCDDLDSRTEIMVKCLAGMGKGFDSVTYFGDAEWDKKASGELGWDFIGIGNYIKGKCEKWLPDYLNRKALTDILGLI